MPVNVFGLLSLKFIHKLQHLRSRVPLNPAVPLTQKLPQNFSAAPQARHYTLAPVLGRKDQSPAIRQTTQTAYTPKAPALTLNLVRVRNIPNHTHKILRANPRPVVLNGDVPTLSIKLYPDFPFALSNDSRLHRLVYSVARVLDILTENCPRVLIHSRSQALQNVRTYRNILLHDFSSPSR